jgi:hypothetical protein
MELIREMSEKYNGNVDVAVQFVDKANKNIVFNIYVQVNENDIIKMKPLLVEEMPKEDIKIEINFDEIYNLIYEQQKEFEGERIESPPWDKKFSPIGKVKEITNGIQMYFKIRGIISSATITPESAEKDIRKLLNKFFAMMMKEGMNDDNGGNQEEGKELGQEQKKEGQKNSGKV